MHSSLLAVFAALASYVTAQNLGSIPACATTNCVEQLLPSSCNLNPSCICADSNFINNISCCVFRNCNATDQTAALDYARTICTPVGVTLPAQASCPNNATSTTSASSSSAAATSSGAAERYAANGLGIVGAMMGAVAML